VRKKQKNRKERGTPERETQREKSAESERKFQRGTRHSSERERVAVRDPAERMQVAGESTERRRNAGNREMQHSSRRGSAVASRKQQRVPPSRPETQNEALPAGGR